MTMTRTLIPVLLLVGLAACSNDSGNTAALVEVAQAAARQSDRAQVEQLAEWLIEERQDFVLVDVRAPSGYDKGHIGEARNLAIAELVTDATMSSLPTDRKVVVYSNGSENGAKAATLLRVAGINAQVLVGGYNAWQARILNPDIPAEELDGESLQVSEQRAFACYFVGDRGEGAARRSQAEFVPPVFDEDDLEDDEPLPPAAEESC